MIYADTLSEYKREIQWKIIIKEFGTNINNISIVDNIVYDTLIRL